jgi:serine/threonine-protein kinase HipA
VSDNKLEVWIDADFIDKMTKVGTLSHNRGNVRFNYDKGWLAYPNCFDIDPDLSLDDATFHPNPELGNFGIFLDSSPDRWGQTLMKRREALEAKDQKRSPKTLYAWDFLIGVQDLTRQGALRFKYEGTDTFLSSHELAAPPVTVLRELEEVARELTNKRIDDLDALRRWLRVLVAPGASLGGARPKANFKESDGSIWIAKFPTKDDDRDIGAWEGVVHKLAKQAKLDVPPAKVFRLNSEYHTFCVKRFDRNEDKRVFYASAMTMLKRSDSDGASYLDIAQFLMTSAAKHHVTSDLEQLFRRVVFNVAVGNRDDHLRNHGFVLTHTGWRLSPAFDVNPNIDKADHVLHLDGIDNRPNMDSVLETAELYELEDQKAEQILEEVISVVISWKDVAKRLGIANAEIELMETAFMQYDKS